MGVIWGSYEGYAGSEEGRVWGSEGKNVQKICRYPLRTYDTFGTSDFGKSAKNPVKVFESENLSCFTVSFDTIIPGFKLIPGSSEKSRGRGKQACRVGNYVAIVSTLSHRQKKYPVFHGNMCTVEYSP